MNDVDSHSYFMASVDLYERRMVIAFVVDVSRKQKGKHTIRHRVPTGAITTGVSSSSSISVLNMNSRTPQQKTNGSIILPNGVKIDLGDINRQSRNGFGTERENIVDFSSLSDYITIIPSTKEVELGFEKKDEAEGRIVFRQEHNAIESKVAYSLRFKEDPQFSLQDGYSPIDLDVIYTLQISNWPIAERIGPNTAVRVHREQERRTRSRAAMRQAFADSGPSTAESSKENEQDSRVFFFNTVEFGNFGQSNINVGQASVLYRCIFDASMSKNTALRVIDVKRENLEGSLLLASKSDRRTLDFFNSKGFNIGHLDEEAAARQRVPGIVVISNLPGITVSRKVVMTQEPDQVVMTIRTTIRNQRTASSDQDLLYSENPTASLEIWERRGSYVELLSNKEVAVSSPNASYYKDKTDGIIRIPVQVAAGKEGILEYKLYFYTSEYKITK